MGRLTEDERDERFWILQDVRARDKDRCRSCSKMIETGGVYHHVKMKSRGGPFAVWNLVQMHDDCHKAVHGAGSGPLLAPSWFTDDQVRAIVDLAERRGYCTQNDEGDTSARKANV